MSFQYEEDFFDDAFDDELGDTMSDVAAVMTGGLSEMPKSTLPTGRQGQTMDAKTQADRLKVFQALGYVDAAGNRTNKPMTTMQDLSNMGMALSGGTAAPVGSPQGQAFTDWLINAQRAASALPSPSSPAPRIETPGATPAVVTPPTLPALDLSGITRALDPRLRNILGGVNAMRLQAQATSEHNAMMKEAQFRKEAIRRLTAIESKLPRSSLLSQQIRTVKVLLG